jgi:Domain of unknown function (DUF4907)
MIIWMSLDQQKLTMQMIKKYWVYGLLLFSISFFIYKKFLSQDNSLQVKTFAVQQGWGYDILVNNKVFIHQEIIPSIQGKKYFVSKQEAESVGELVVSKMKQGKGGGFPEITEADIDSLKITR